MVRGYSGPTRCSYPAKKDLKWDYVDNPCSALHLTKMKVIRLRWDGIRYVPALSKVSRLWLMRRK